MKVLSSLLLLLCGLLIAESTPSDAQEIRVMTFNLWHGGEAGGEPLERSIEAIRLAGADIVGLQETHGLEVDGVRTDNGPIIAKKLGWHYLDQGGRTGILSRFPIIDSTPRNWGAKIVYAEGRELWFFNAHFPASPYQPYQLLNIAYGEAPFIRTESEAIDWAKRSRGRELASLFIELEPSLKTGIPVFLTGDFNEPSFQDWTIRAVEAGLCPLKVAFPTTKRVTELGMKDAWRMIHPDEVAQPGMTWTPTTRPTDPEDHHDRIDFVFVSEREVKVTGAQRVAEPGGSELSMLNWPSDHRAVVATIVVGETTIP